MNQTKIEWADATWNPVTGCTPVSEGCEHCYAARMAKRLAGRFGYPKDDPFRVTFHPERLEEPVYWKKPRKIFVCSMGDLFHKDDPFECVARVWDTMFDTPQHTYMILTKRVEEMLAFSKWMESHARRSDYPNVWLGVTVENQRTAVERIPLLLNTPAALRFVSVEPMLTSVNLRFEATWDNTDSGFAHGPALEKLDWVICGAETGPGARPMHYNWGRRLCDQCRSSVVPFFFKRGNGGEEPPSDLLVREWPLCCQEKGS